MGTQKRERQKANRAQKVEDQRKQEQRDLTKDRGLIIGLIAVAVIAALGLWVVFGDTDEKPENIEIFTEEPAVPEQPLPTAANDPSTETTEATDNTEPTEEITAEDTLETTEAE